MLTSMRSAPPGPSDSMRCAMRTPRQRSVCMRLMSRALARGHESGDPRLKGHVLDTRGDVHAWHRPGIDGRAIGTGVERKGGAIPRCAYGVADTTIPQTERIRKERRCLAGVLGDRL